MPDLAAVKAATTKPKAWTRATTVANTLADRFALEQWAQRNLVYGLGQRQDLYALAASTKPDDKKALNKIAKDAQEYAKASSGANLGTALHSFTEAVDRGEDIEIPSAWKADIGAYRKAMRGFDILHIERIVVVPQLRIAGTLDRIVRDLRTDELFIADVKTGANAVKYGSGEIAIQLAIYAGASHMWKGTSDDIDRDQWGRYLLPDPEKNPDAYEPMPKVSRDKALVIHLPVDAHQCDLYEIDIAAGREATRWSMQARDWRKRRDLAQPYKSKVN